MPNNNGSTLEEDDDSDECDVYVSPSHFVGRTPGRKATRQKIFEEQHSTRHDSAPPQSKPVQQSMTEDRNDAKTSHPVHTGSVKYTIEHDQSGTSVQSLFKSRNTLIT